MTEKVKLNEITDIYLGVTHTPEYVLDGVPFLSVKDISGGKICFDECKFISQKEYNSLSEGAKPKVGDMLFCRVGTIGKPIIIPEGTPLFGSFVSLGYLRNKAKDRCNLNYLRYWMYSNSFWKQVNKNVKGASQVNLNTGWLSNFEIRLPDFSEQTYIVSILDKCKLIIERREEELKKFDNLIRARFFELFGDLVEGDKIKDNRRKIGDIASVTKLAGFEFTKYIKYKDIGSIGDSDVIMLRGLNCKGGKLVLDDIKWIDRETSDLLPRSKLYVGDILITYAGTIGDIALVDEDNKYHLAPNVGKISIIDKLSYDPVFLVHLLMYSNKYIMSFASKVAQASINMQKIRNFEYYFPSFEEQKHFSTFVEQVNKSKVEVKRALDEAQLLFDSLMQKYFG